MTDDKSPFYAAFVALLNAVLGLLSAFGVFQFTDVEKDALTAVFAAAFTVAVILIPVFTHRNAIEAKRLRR